MLPYRLISIISLGSAYALSSGRIPQLPEVRFLPGFAAIWAIQALAWAIWIVLLYPKLFSPLRGLPEPNGNSWFMGQFRTIMSQPTGAPMREWYVSPPL